MELLTSIIRTRNIFIDDAYESRDAVIDSFREATVPLSDAEKDAMCRDRFRSGVETDESDIDDVLYG